MSGHFRASALFITALVGLGLWATLKPNSPILSINPHPNRVVPLKMDGGDPHIRALMRTISASESGGASPYTVLYGGTHVQDLSKHPNRCIPIAAGPNVGNCSTAAGRYQFINTTWAEKAAAYHPNPSGVWLWNQYSFEPHYQDQVVYAWLSDRRAWGMDIAAQLQAGNLQPVLKRLSSTWTSLGYGIEDNVVTPRLGKIYQQLLTEELSLELAAQEGLNKFVTGERPQVGNAFPSPNKPNRQSELLNNS